MKYFMRHVFCFWLCLLAMVPLKSQAQTKEYEIKAAFLFNFAQFVDWPATAFTNTDTPFSIGILGSDPFGAALEATVEGETIKNHRIIIERAKRIADLKNCQLIFISKSEEKQLAKIFSALDDRTVLTIS